MSGKIRVLIADDQKLFAESLRYVLEGSAEDIEVLAIAGDGVEAVSLAERLKPDLILMDARMPEMDGVDAARLVLARLPQTKVIILSTFLDPAQAKAAVSHGACGYLLKDMRPTDLVESIRAAQGGASLFSGEVAKCLAEEKGRGDLISALSPREAQVADLVRRSYGNRQIAQKLGLSEQTVRNYISAIYFKLGVRDRFEFMRATGTIVPGN